jgi:hypothetical protein
MPKPTPFLTQHLQRFHAHLIQHLPTGRWCVQCGHCGQTVEVDSLYDVLDPDDFEGHEGDLTAALDVVCPSCTDAPWRAVYPESP